MENEPQQEQLKERELTEIEKLYKKIVGGDPDEIIIIDRKRYRKKSVMQSLEGRGPITEKEYYYHPGPGWDNYRTYIKALTELTDRAEKEFREYFIERGPASILSDEILYKLVLIKE